MDTDQEPIDENLRLILSADQEQWLQKKIDHSRKFIRDLIIIIAFCLAWFVIDLAGVFKGKDALDCFHISADAPDYQELHDRFVAEGLESCSSMNAGKKWSVWKKNGVLLTLGSVFAIFASLLGIIRHLYLLWKLEGYKKDHQAFLKKYGRRPKTG